LKIVWTDEAIEHLEAIVTYVSVYDPAAAERLSLPTGTYLSRTLGLPVTRVGVTEKAPRD